MVVIETASGRIVRYCLTKREDQYISEHHRLERTLSHISFRSQFSFWIWNNLSLENQEHPTTTATMSSKNNSSKPLLPPRPYTAYNIFFQIEREYILQQLGVVPKLKPEDIFSTSNVNYDGPPLPARYQDLTLPYDWHVPGKGRRKKRRHKASHGVISFTDLSKQIST